MRGIENSSQSGLSSDLGPLPTKGVRHGLSTSREDAYLSSIVHDIIPSPQEPSNRIFRSATRCIQGMRSSLTCQS
jgi:hypothetical protein